MRFVRIIPRSIQLVVVILIVMCLSIGGIFTVAKSRAVTGSDTLSACLLSRNINGATIITDVSAPKTLPDRRVPDEIAAEIGDEWLSLTNFARHLYRKIPQSEQSPTTEHQFRMNTDLRGEKIISIRTNGKIFWDSTLSHVIYAEEKAPIDSQTAGAVMTYVNLADEFAGRTPSRTELPSGIYNANVIDYSSFDIHNNYLAFTADIRPPNGRTTTQVYVVDREKKQILLDAPLTSKQMQATGYTFSWGGQLPKVAFIEWNMESISTLR